MNRDQSSDPKDEIYGLIERQIAFKLLASHAMVDAEFYAFLRTDPELAAASLHILLTEEDVASSVSRPRRSFSSGAKPAKRGSSRKDRRLRSRTGHSPGDEFHHARSARAFLSQDRARG